MHKTLLSTVAGAIVGGLVVFIAIGRGGGQPTQQLVENTPAPQESTQPTTDVVSVDSAQKFETKTVEVQYTASGFNPKAIRVAPGTTVTFKNQTNQKMWVASDPHDTHSDYPKLNQDQVGMSYSHEFEKVGTYNYHNHQNPEYQGTVFVE